MTVNILDIVKNPEKYGFKWATSASHSGTGASKKLLREDAPVMEHLDADLLTQTFGPAYLLASANGTSARVRDQRVNRDTLEKNLTISNDELKVKIVNAALGQRAPRTQTVVEKSVYVGLDGNKYATMEEAQEASKAYLEMADDE